MRIYNFFFKPLLTWVMVDTSMTPPNFILTYSSDYSTIINFVGSILQDVYRAELPGLATPLHWNCTSSWQGMCYYPILGILFIPLLTTFTVVILWLTIDWRYCQVLVGWTVTFCTEIDAFLTWSNSLFSSAKLFWQLCKSAEVEHFSLKAVPVLFSSRIRSSVLWSSFNVFVQLVQPMPGVRD